MKLKEYAKHIAAIAKKYPDAVVIAAGDDEGDSYNEVVYSPTPGNMKDGEFFTNIAEGVTTVCIN